MPKKRKSTKLEVRIEAKAKNAILARLADEYGGAKAAAETVGVSYATFLNWLNFRSVIGLSTEDSWGRLKIERQCELVLRLEQLTGRSITDIFPVTKRDLEPLAKKRVYERTIERKALRNYAVNEAARLTHQIESNSPERAIFIEEIGDRLVQARREHLLSTREYDWLRLRFGLDSGKERTLHEVAIIVHVTAARIKQVIDKALMKLHSAMKSEGWDED